MTRKLLSLATATGMLYVYLQSQLHSADALFLVTSDNIALNLSLLAMAGVAVYLSFQEKFQKWQSYIATAAAGVLLSLVGLGGIVFVSLDNYFSGLIKPLDYVVLLLIGIMYGIFALSYKHQPVDFRRPQLNRISWLKLSQRLSNSLPRPAVSQPQSRKARPA